jgi:hypothetical protein
MATSDINLDVAIKASLSGSDVSHEKLFQFQRERKKQGAQLH